MDPHSSVRAALTRLRRRAHRLTATTTAGGVMLVGMPFALDYVVRPGDTLSEIAARNDTSVSRLVKRNRLDSGDQIVVGQRLHVPGKSRPSRPAPRRISPDKRRIVRYTVRRGDTPSGLAVRFNAWTAELIAMNGSVLRAGERIRIPVVVAAAAEDRRAKAHRATPKRAKPQRAKPAARPKAAKAGPKAKPRRSASRPTPSRATVRRVITRTSLRHAVNPDLALAVSWQESGWQMNRTSSAGAIGAMQVMPDTGKWMSALVGRRLYLRDLQDNVTAGVVLLKILRQEVRLRVAIAGYYQGLTGVRRHGMYDDTKRYVANVMALRKRFMGGSYPA